MDNNGKSCSLNRTLSQIPVVLLLFILLNPTGGGAYVNFLDVKRPGPPEPMILDGKNHDMNQVYLRVNNTGQFGTDLQSGNGTAFWPIGTSNNYLFGSGLLIGARADVDGDSTLEKVFVQGYNVFAGDSEYDPGRPGQDPEDPAARIYDSNDPVDLAEWPEEFRDPVSGQPLVYSQQDFVTIYNDVARRPIFGTHNLGIEVRQRTMAFVHDLSADVIYVEWDLTNVSERMENGPYTFEDAWIGYDSDSDVGYAFGDDLASFFREIVTPAGDTLTIDAAVVWDSDFSEANFTGTPGFMGLALIQSPGNDNDGIDNDGDGMVDESPFNGVDDDGDGDIDEPDEVDELGLVNFSRHCCPSVPCQVTSPQTDYEGYDLISCISEANPDSSSQYVCLESTDPSDIRHMLSSGPFDWHPGETIRVRFAFVFSAPVGADPNLRFVGDPPRPDPNDPVLVNFIEVVREARRFGRSGYSDYGTLPSIHNLTYLLPINIPFYDFPTSVSIFDTVGIAGADLFYSIDGSPFEEIELENVGNGVWESEIPGPDLGSRVEFFYEAVDSLFQVNREPEGAPETTFRYDVVRLPEFTDVSDDAGLPGGTWNYSGMAVADYDEDGDQDFYLVGTRSQNALYRNNGDGTFTDATVAADLIRFSGTGAAWADYDNDGHLDLFVVDHDFEKNWLFRNDGDGTFTSSAYPAGIDRRGFMSSLAWGDYDNDGFVDIYLFSSSANSSDRNALYRNNGDGTFTNVAEEMGLDFFWPGNPPRYRAVIWVDVDNDGWQDLFLTNPQDQVAHLYRNNRDGTFTDIAGESDIREAYWMQVAFADYDNDGDLDAITGMETVDQGGGGGGGGGGGDAIYVNDGEGRFTDITETLNFTEGIFLDVNNSGFLDVVSPRRWRNSVFHLNRGDEFIEIAELLGLDLFPFFRFPLSFDYDNDGDLDIATLDNREILYRNEGFTPEYAHNWLHVKCVGMASNRAAIGAKVRVTTDDLTQTRVVGGASSLVQSGLLAEFGVGDARQVDRLVVEWPSGKVQEYPNLAVNRIITIIEDEDLVGIGGGKGGISSGAIPKVFALTQNYPNPFNPSTTIGYDIPDVTDGSRAGPEAVTGDPGDMPTVPVRIMIYDIRGRLIEKLVDSDIKPGRYQVHWNGRDGRGSSVASGVYLYRIDAGDFSSTKKMVLVR